MLKFSVGLLLIISLLAGCSENEPKQGDLSRKAETMFHAKAIGQVSASSAIDWLGKPSWVLLPGDIIGDDPKPRIYKTDPIQFMLYWKAESGCSAVSASFDMQGYVNGWNLGKTCSGDDPEMMKMINDGLNIYMPFSCEKDGRNGYCG